MSYFCFCENDFKHETMSKEQIMNAIAAATGNDPSPADKAFITMILDQNKNKNLKLWIGTEAQYNALGEYDLDTLYFYPDSDYEAIYAEYKRIQESVAGGVAKLAEFAEKVGKYPRVTFLTSVLYSVVLNAENSTHTEFIKIAKAPTTRAEIEVVTSCGSGKMSVHGSNHTGISDVIAIPVYEEGTFVGYCRVFIKYDSANKEIAITAACEAGECRIQSFKIIDYGEE